MSISFLDKGCYSSSIHFSTDSSDSELPLFPELSPASRTSLDLFWKSPVYRDIPFTDYDYTVTVSGADGYMETSSVFVNATELPHHILNLGGHECEEIEVRISLPGNCEPTKLTGSLLTGKYMYA